MAFVQGTSVTLEVEGATPGTTWIQVDGIDNYSRKSGRASTKKSVFMRATQVKSTGALDETITMAGLFDPTDPGQLKIQAKKATNTPFLVRITFDGTNGFTQLVRCGNGDSDFKPDDFGTVSFTLEAEDSAVIAGSGPIA